MNAISFKQSICAGFIILSSLTIPASSLGVTVGQVPNPRQINGGWVTDMADLLTPETETQINQMISEVEAKNGTEIAIVTLPDIAPSATVKEFTTALFNYWHIGKADRNNGVLFLISQGNRRVEIETGSGLTTILPDDRVSKIIQEEIVPSLKQGDYNSGTLSGTKALVLALENDSTIVYSSFDSSSSYQIIWYICLLVIFGGFIVTITGISRRKLKKTKSNLVAIQNTNSSQANLKNKSCNNKYQSSFPPSRQSKIDNHSDSSSLEIEISYIDTSDSNIDTSDSNSDTSDSYSSNSDSNSDTSDSNSDTSDSNSDTSDSNSDTSDSYNSTSDSSYNSTSDSSYSSTSDSSYSSTSDSSYSSSDFGGGSSYGGGAGGDF
ncbi:TPM domain-containing protein [Limnofasciculus baicalensis]|uniref:TPM domain-containing protein n=1 Tax=Limnofasciculus baicalensis BBK-W-15 TaxID=2699891 RepID=A0AAE3GQ88_9CYAN|nr:TPM domain-containing protein [Limnofasciculus baicalensis]MCP2728524.1 TPM domain-containing protein [Limnofasciculus baicalensis BBK-W-15]